MNENNTESDTNANDLEQNSLADSCIVPEYPGAVEDANNDANINNEAGSAYISQSAFISLDSEANVQAWFDSEMNDPWIVESDWNRGNKRWTTSNFDIAGQSGCSLMISAQENSDGHTTIGVVLMDFS